MSMFRVPVAVLRQFGVEIPISYLRETAPNADKYAKREWPRTYFYLSGRPLNRLVRYLRTGCFLVSYPKCGRTWLRTMIGRALILLHDLDPDRFLDVRWLSRRAGSVDNLWALHDDSPLWKTPSELETDKSAYMPKKVLFLVRSPKDVIVSSYFHMAKRMKVVDEPLSEFLRRERGGIGTIVRYYNVWHGNRRVPRDFLRIHYEAMHEDPHEVLRRVLGFLGWSSPSEEIVRDAVSFASFDNMRRMEADESRDKEGLSPADPEDENSYMTRKGRIGGHRDDLSPEDVDFLDRRIEDTLADAYPYPL